MDIAFIVVGIEIDYEEFTKEDKFDFLKEYVEENDFSINGGRIYKNFNGSCDEYNDIVVFGDSIMSCDGEEIRPIMIEKMAEKTKEVKNNLKEIFDKVKEVTKKDVQLYFVVEQDLY